MARLRADWCYYSGGFADDGVYRPPTTAYTGCAGRETFEDEFNSVYVNDPAKGFSPGQTTFDNGFTTFVRSINDSGVVYLYENVNDTLVFGQRLKYDNFEVKDFGKNAIVQDNTILVGRTTLDHNGSHLPAPKRARVQVRRQRIRKHNHRREH